MDNYESHLSIEAIVFACKNGIVIHTILPHTSSKLQPLDKVVFGPFKTYFSRSMNFWMIHNLRKPVTIYDLAAKNLFLLGTKQLSESISNQHSM